MKNFEATSIKSRPWRIGSWINFIRRMFIGCACQHSSHDRLQLIRFIDATDVNEVSGRVSGTNERGTDGGWRASGKREGEYGPFDARKKAEALTARL